jgi:hypothetical protein
MLVVDTMHCLFEGLIKLHCRVALNLTVANAEVRDPVLPAFEWVFRPVDSETSKQWVENDIKCVAQIHKLLVQPIEDTEEAFDVLYDKLKKKNSKSLLFVCQDLRCVPDSPDGKNPSKALCTAALITWRKARPLVNTDAYRLRLITPAVIARIRGVMRDMVKPSWLNSLPSDAANLFGTDAAGSFKADEWRTFFTVFLPVALVSLWGDGTKHASPEMAQHLQAVLTHTMSLVSAVLVAGSRYMTPDRALSYKEYIRDYVAGLPKLYPHVAPRTNLHVAFHVYDFLLLYGPIRSWWCFPFERLVGVLQNLSSNHKIGMYLLISSVESVADCTYRSDGRNFTSVVYCRQ